VRTRVRIIALAVALAVVDPAAASADWFITPFLGIKFASSTSIVDLEQGASNPKMTLGVSATILSDRILGFEGELGYSPRFFERSGTSNLIARSNVTTLFGNVLFAVPRAITRDSLRPYALVGLGLIHVGIDDSLGILPVDTNLAGMVSVEERLADSRTAPACDLRCATSAISRRPTRMSSTSAQPGGQSSTGVPPSVCRCMATYSDGGFFFLFDLTTRPLCPPVTNICTTVPSRPSAIHA
jgi:hypothetical protein